MSKEYNEEVRLQSLKEFVDEYANEEELTSVDGVRATIDIIEEQLNNYKKLLNANPSEAMEYVENIQSEIEWALEFNGRKIEEYEPKHFDTIKQALLKAQQPKHYLKWEDLEFEENNQRIKVKLGSNIYTLDFYIGQFGKTFVLNLQHYCEAKDNIQFFNDLHLERVEE